jgi:hypothetical protein
MGDDIICEQSELKRRKKKISREEIMNPSLMTCEFLKEAPRGAEEVLVLNRKINVHHIRGKRA